MTKSLLLITFILSFGNLYGYDFEVRAACLIPQENRYRHVYGKSIMDWEMEMSTPICKDFAGWTNLSYYTKKGHFTYLKESTSVINWALNLGVKGYFCRSGCFSPYLGCGLGPAYVRFRDNSFYVKQKINLWGVALLAKSGIEMEIDCNFFLDVFVDYSFNTFSKPHAMKGITTNGTNTGGVKMGMGLGYRW